MHVHIGKVRVKKIHLQGLKLGHTTSIATMKLLIATGLYPPDMGGPATYTVFLEKHLPKLGITPIVIPYGSVRSYPIIIRHFVYLFKLIKSAKNVDVLYALDTVSVGLPVRIASMLTGKPYMLRVPGDYAWEQGQQRFGITETLDEYLAHPQRNVFVRLMASIQTHVAQYAHHIVVPSDYLKLVVMQWGINGEKITRVYSALKVIEVPETKWELKNRLASGVWTVTTAGRLVPWKGVHALIAVIKQLTDEGHDVRLEILGDGVCRKELEALVVSFGITDRVVFYGVLEREEMARRIKSSDVFVLNTSYEGLSHQLIEVMSLGTSIVTTDVGGNPELITNGETGTLIAYNDTKELHDALLAYRNNESLAENHARRARERIKLFHEDAVVQEFISLMRTLWKF